MIDPRRSVGLRGPAPSPVSRAAERGRGRAIETKNHPQLRARGALERGEFPPTPQNRGIRNTDVVSCFRVSWASSACNSPSELPRHGDGLFAISTNGNGIGIEIPRRRLARVWLRLKLYRPSKAEGGRRTRARRPPTGSPAAPRPHPILACTMYSCVYHLNPNQQSIRNRTCAYFGPPMMLP